MFLLLLETGAIMLMVRLLMAMKRLEVPPDGMSHVYAHIERYAGGVWSEFSMNALTSIYNYFNR